MKFRYPITPQYVSDWGLNHALREVISNGYDAEAEHGATCSVAYNAAKQTLVVKNENVNVDVHALYFGESSKRGDSRFVGQYGEGLKLAMLVFARSNIPVVIKNGRFESWKPLLEKDGLGVESLCVEITKTNRNDNDFEVIVPGITEEGWETIQSWFLKLKTPCERHVARAGELLDDPEFTGRIYVRGVYVTTRPQYEFGYNFLHVDTGRDRRIPSTHDVDWAISSMWAELASRADAKLLARMYKAFERECAEQDVFQYVRPDELAEKMLALFHCEYGDDAVPVMGTVEGQGLEHLGKVPVTLPTRLVGLLRQRIASPEQMIREYSQRVEERFALSALAEDEAANFRAALALLRPEVPNIDSRALVVRFASNEVDGLHSGEEVYIARHTLKDFGKLSMLLVHEFAHDDGVDGTSSHVRAIHRLSERVINALWRRLQKAGA